MCIYTILTKYFCASVEDENLREELKQTKHKSSLNPPKKPRLTEGQLLLEAIKNIPELRSHKPEMLNCRVAVQKLPTSLAKALTPPQTNATPSPNKSKPSGKKDTEDEARAKRYCFTCRKWFDRPHRLQLHMKLVREFTFFLTLLVMEVLVKFLLIRFSYNFQEEPL